MPDSAPPPGNVKDLIHQLRLELQSLDRGGGTRDRLHDLTDRIEQQIESDLDGTQQDALVEELNDELVEFEVNHPTLAGIVQNLVRMLGNIGV